METGIDPSSRSAWAPAGKQAAILLGALVLTVIGNIVNAATAYAMLGRWAFTVGAAVFGGVIYYAFNAHERERLAKAKPPEESEYLRARRLVDALRSEQGVINELMARVPDESHYSSQDHQIAWERCDSWKKRASEVRHRVQNVANAAPPAIGLVLLHPHKKSPQGRKPTVYGGEMWDAQVRLFEIEQGIAEALLELDRHIERCRPKRFWRK